MTLLENPPYKQEVAGSSPALPTKNPPTFQPFSGNLVEELLDIVDRILLPYRSCDGHDFYMGLSVDCPLRPVRNINGQDFCEKHSSQAWVNQ